MPSMQPTLREFVSGGIPKSGLGHRKAPYRLPRPKAISFGYRTSFHPSRIRREEVVEINPSRPFSSFFLLPDDSFNHDSCKVAHLVVGLSRFDITIRTVLNYGLSGDWGG
jgi:hypothetical protein